jgi:mannosyltransferase
MVAEARTAAGAGRVASGGAGRPLAGGVAPDVWLVLALTAVGALLRFGTLASQSFWVDEATTVHEVGLSFGAMLHAVAHHEATPPLYFALAWVWTRVFGAGEAGIRSLSALAGTAAIPVAYGCGRELVSRRAGVVAALLTAASPWMIWYSQEARSYMLFALLSALSLLFATRAARAARGARRGARRELGAWVAVCALAMLTHFFAGFLVAGECVWLLWARRDRAALVAVAGVAAVQAALLPLVLGDHSRLIGWIAGLGLASRIDQIPVQFGVSQLYLSPSPLVSHGLLLAAALGTGAAALLWLAGDAPTRRGAAVATALAAAAILVPIALAEAGRDYVVPRNLMPAWIPLAVVLGAACTVPRARALGALLAAALVAAFVWAGVVIDGNPAYQRDDWRGAAAALGTAAGTRAIVAYEGNLAEQPLAVYLPRTGFSYSGVPAGAGRVDVSEVDVVGSAGETVASHLPAGVRLTASRTVDQILVERFSVSPSWTGTPAALAARASRLLTPAPSGPSVLIQPAAPAGADAVH